MGNEPSNNILILCFLLLLLNGIVSIVRISFGDVKIPISFSIGFFEANMNITNDNLKEKCYNCC